MNGVNAAVQSLSGRRFLYYDAYTAFLLKPSSVPYDQMVTLKLGTMDAYSVADIAADFNASSERIQIEVVDYSQYEAPTAAPPALTGWSWTSCPETDRIFTTCWPCPGSSMKKAGRLADLYPFMEKTTR